MTILKIHQVTLEIEKRTFVENFSLQFHPSEIWGIFGPNGAGKTTLLHALAGLKKPCVGDIHLNDRSLFNFKPKQRAKKIGILLQDTEFPFPSTVLESAMIGRFPHQKHWLYDLEEDQAIAMHALVQVNLDGFADRDVQTLSGGEKRRLSLATLLAQNPDIFLLDEPTNHLDIEQQLQLLEILKNQATQQNKTIIMILHDLPLIKRYCNNLIVFDYLPQLSAGKSVELIEQLTQHKPHLFYAI